ncbi:hypothetical protein [Chitinophaga sp.]|uniref:hypothetical protein n=1 Tax=Chitinophaga sp. TaxID=1869181 RepID=UPI002F94422A
MFITATILLLFCILRLVILISSTVQLLSKDAELLKQRAAEEKDYLLIKGFY